jgi:hypothetical protein
VIHGFANADAFAGIAGAMSEKCHQPTWRRACGMSAFPQSP